MTPALVHVNGASAVGKSTVARLVVEKRPLAMYLDIDTIRVTLGGWLSHPESKGAARAAGFAMASAHLLGGHDVVLPQLIARLDVVESLAQRAADAGATFVEVMLRADPATLRSRFLARRADLAAAGTGHPQDDFVVDVLDDVIADTQARLAAIVDARPHTIVLESMSAEDACNAIVTELERAS